VYLIFPRFKKNSSEKVHTQISSSKLLLIICYQPAEIHINQTLPKKRQ